MKKQVQFLFLIIIIFGLGDVYSQEKIKIPQNETVVNIISLGFTGGFDMPGADLYDNFGNSYSVGGTFIYKTNKNWSFSLEGDFLFGNDVKLTDQLFEEIATEDGNIINQGGIYTQINMMERGFTSNISVGKLIPVFGPNKNSGIFFSIGVGYMYHKIRIEQDEEQAPQISGDYAKGYDRLSGGIVITEFLGYHYYGSNNIVNFFVGFELHQGLTQSRRPWNFDEMKAPPSSRLDLLNGIKIGWLIPLGKQTSRKTFSF